jgi:DNA-binding PadR family transcriptional regulator
MNDDLFRELLITSEGMKAPPREVPPELKERFERAIDLHCKPQVLTEIQMRLVILQVLAKGRLDGAEIVEKLDALKIKLADEGEGVILALLARMEDEGFVSGNFDEAMVRKIYRVEEHGSSLLNRNADAVRNLSPQIAMLWAT